MASNNRPSLRARDIDRALTASALDTAYAEGQLSVEEHGLRSEKARTAVTLEQLRPLVGDLQLEVDLPEPAVRRPDPGRRVVLALGSVVVVAAGLAGYFVARENEPEVSALAEPTEVVTATAALPENVTPIVARPFVFDTAAGLDDFRARYIERFGSSEVLSLSLRIDDDARADVYRLNPEGRVERVTVNGGFDTYKDTELLDEGQIPFDWALLDSAVVAGVIAGAPETVGAPQGIPNWVTIDNDEGEQRISVSVEAPDLRGGRAETDFAGNSTYVSPSTR